MAVAEATGDGNNIIKQVLVKRPLDTVSSELKAFLKEQEP